MFLLGIAIRAHVTNWRINVRGRIVMSRSSIIILGTGLRSVRLSDDAICRRMNAGGGRHFEYLSTFLGFVLRLEVWERIKSYKKRNVGYVG